jgi:hypothetical protein
MGHWSNRARLPRTTGEGDVEVGSCRGVAGSARTFVAEILAIRISTKKNHAYTWAEGCECAWANRARLPCPSTGEGDEEVCGGMRACRKLGP